MWKIPRKGSSGENTSVKPRDRDCTKNPLNEEPVVLFSITVVIERNDVLDNISKYLNYI